MLLELMFLASVYCYQLRPAMAEDSESNLKAVVSSMRTLDQVLSTTLQKCLNATGLDGDAFMRNLTSYNKKIEEFLEFIAEDKLKALSEAEDILTKGGPDFLDEDAEEDQFMKCFNWTEDQVNSMYKVRLTTFRLWNQLVTINNNFP